MCRSVRKTSWAGVCVCVVGDVCVCEGGGRILRGGSVLSTFLGHSTLITVLVWIIYNTAAYTILIVLPLLHHIVCTDRQTDRDTTHLLLCLEQWCEGGLHLLELVSQLVLVHQLVSGDQVTIQVKSLLTYLHERPVREGGRRGRGG